MVYLLECLQKTPPPVLIFCENKSDVDDIHEYLLQKGVEAVSIHGDKVRDHLPRHPLATTHAVPIFTLVCGFLL